MFKHATNRVACRTEIVDTTPDSPVYACAQIGRLQVSLLFMSRRNHDDGPCRWDRTDPDSVVGEAESRRIRSIDLGGYRGLRLLFFRFIDHMEPAIHQVG